MKASTTQHVFIGGNPSPTFYGWFAVEHFPTRLKKQKKTTKNGSSP